MIYSATYHFVVGDSPVLFWFGLVFCPELKKVHLEGIGLSLGHVGPVSQERLTSSQKQVQVGRGKLGP